MNGKRPKLYIPQSHTELLLQMAAIAGIAAAAGFAAAYWPALSPRIPTHFGADGLPDAWGSKSGILVIGLIGVALSLSMFVLRWYPHIYNYPVVLTEENIRTQYRLARCLVGWMSADIAWIFAYIEWSIIQIALGRMDGLGSFFTPLVLFSTLGATAYYLYRAYRAR